MRRGILVPAVLLFCLPAWAQEADEAEDVRPGALDEPPGPDPDDTAPPVAEGDEGERRAIRGSAPEKPRPEDPNEAALAEWEERTFPRNGRVPAEEDEAAPPASEPRSPVLGKDELPVELRAPHHEDRPGRRVARRPEEVRPDLTWLRGLRTGDLPVTWDPKVIKYLEYYRDDPKGQALIRGWFAAQRRFRKLISSALKRHGLPQDLIYLCMIESSYDPWEYSRVGASGLWQFMPSGAKVYGMKIDFWVDERNDPERSTEAAMLYWRDLYARFGDWDLAMAAYNAGFGAVLKAMAKFNTNDFWRLVDIEGALPWGSSIYVPKALAVAVIGHNREVFGIEGLAEEPAWEFDRVTVPTSVSLEVIGRAVGVSGNDIAWLNPELRRGRTPPGVKDYAVRIPKGKKELFARAFPQLRGDWDGFDAYVMRYGERFEDVARVHGISPQKLRELNGVADAAEVRGGTIIVVPKVDDGTKAKNRRLADADLYHSDPAAGGPDDPMIVAVPDKDFVVKGKKRVFYRVVPGDELGYVAAALGVRPAELAGWNALDPDARLQPRMVLVAWVDPSFDPAAEKVALLDESRLVVVTSGSPEHLDLIEARKGRKRVTVKAKKGDTLESLGKRYQLGKYEIARINRRSPSDKLEAGEEVVVYVVVDRAKAKKAGVFDKKKRKLDPPKRPRKPRS